MHIPNISSPSDIELDLSVPYNWLHPDARETAYIVPLPDARETATPPTTWHIINYVPEDLLNDDTPKE